MHIACTCKAMYIHLHCVALFGVLVNGKATWFFICHLLERKFYDFSLDGFPELL